MAGMKSRTPWSPTPTTERAGAVGGAAGWRRKAASSASITSRGGSSRSSSPRERISTGSGHLAAPDHALHARLEDQPAALVEHAVPVGDDAAVGLLRLALFHDLDLHPDRIAREHGRHDADLSAQPGHPGAVDEPGLHHEAFRQRERERPRARLAGRRPTLARRTPCP